MFANETKTVKIGGHTFFYVYDFLPPDVVENLVKCVEVDTNQGKHDQAWEVKRAKELLEKKMNHDQWRSWSSTLGPTDDLTMDFLQEQHFWSFYYVKLQYYVQQYLNAAELQYPDLEWASTWFLRSKNNTAQELAKFHKPYDDTGKIFIDKQHHTHIKTHVVGCVYYLKSPSEHYGTAIEFDNHKFISPGKENSLLIFDPRVPHSRTVPSPELSEYPRHAVVTDFKVKEKFGRLTDIITKMRERSAMRRWNKLSAIEDDITGAAALCFGVKPVQTAELSYPDWFEVATNPAAKNEFRKESTDKK
jgi:hypothetical protein